MGDTAVASVTLNALAYPVAIAKQLLIDGWADSYSGVMYTLTALSIYREIAYGKELDPSVATVENVMHFVQSHPYLKTTKSRSSENLTMLLLDYIEFFEGIEFYDESAPGT